MTQKNIIPTYPVSGVTARLRAMRARAAERREIRAVYENTWNELLVMSKRDFAYIGIHRSDIPRIAAEAATME